MGEAVRQADPSATERRLLRGGWSPAAFGRADAAGADSYLRLHEYLPSARVVAGGVRSRLVAAVDPLVMGTAADTPTGRRCLREVVADEGVRALLIVRDGRLLLEHYGAMQPSDVHVWMSVSKTLAGLLVARLWQAGLVDPTHSLVRYLPAFGDTAWRDVRVIDALNMAAGLDGEETPDSTTDPRALITRFFLAEFGATPAGSTGSDYLEVLRTAGRIEASGARTRYSSLVTNMLALMAETVSDTPLSTLLGQVWRAIGAERDAILCLTPDGHGILHGLMLSCARDLARYAVAHTKGARSRIVPPAYLRAIRDDGDPRAFRGSDLALRMEAAFLEPPRHNAWQWDAVFSDGDIFKSGLNGQGLYVSPMKGFAMIWFGARPGGVPLHPFARALARSIA